MVDFAKQRRHPPDCFCGRCISGDLYAPYNHDADTPWNKGPPDTYVTLDAADVHYLCGFVVQQINNLTYSVREFAKESLMLPRSDDGGGATAPATGKRQRRGGVDWMDPEVDLSRTPKEARILAVQSDPQGQYGARVVLKIALDGKTKFWGVAVKTKAGGANPSYQALESKFGHEENDWIDKRILLHLEPHPFYGTMNPAVTFPTEPAKTARK